MYLQKILDKYQARDIANYSSGITQLKSILQTWAGSCFVDIKHSGSRAKGTAISLASDVDLMISLSSGCNENSGGLKSIYNSLYITLSGKYNIVRKQNVSVRLSISGLEVDVTPARKQVGSVNDHWLYVSKYETRKQTNIQKHINDISLSGRTNEIRILKVWRELNKLDFPSIYLEYLLVDNILLNKSKDLASLHANVWHVLGELAKTSGNPLFSRVVDPASSTNILSDLLSVEEKNKIIRAAQLARRQSSWNQIFW